MAQDATPSSLGFYMPSEWHAHESTWLSWPKNELTFPKEMLPRVEGTFVQMASVISQGEKVNILFDSAAAMDAAERKLAAAGAKLGNIVLHSIKSADVWVRDYGPTFLINSKSNRKAAVKWDFNAWGGKYDDLLYDDKTGLEIAKASHLPFFRPNIVMEGGSFDVNGAGALLTTKQCLLNKNRNPKMDREEIAKALQDHLGASIFIWLESGIEGDDTDGHVDDFARFVGEKKIVCAKEDGTGKNSANLGKNFDFLKSFGEFEVAALPMPKQIIEPSENRRLPASYANFYICNKAILLPVFGDKNDKGASELLQSFFPEKYIAMIDSRDLVYGYGGIHCATQQEPKPA